MIATLDNAIEDVLRRAQTIRLRRPPTAAVQELKRLRARGAPVCAFMQLVVNPAEWEATLGRSIAHLRLGAASSPEDLMLDQVTPDAHELRQLIAYNLFLNQLRQGWTPERTLDVVRTVLAEVFTHLRATLRSAPNVFRLDDGIVESLLSTDCDDIVSIDLRLPFEAVCVEFKATPLRISDSLGTFYPVKFITIAESFLPTGREWVVSVFGEPAAQAAAAFGGPIHLHRVYLGGDRITTSPLPASLCADCLGQALNASDYRAAVKRLIINLMLYVSSPNPDVRLASGAGGAEAWDDAVSATRTAVPIARRHGRVLWDVGVSVKRLRIAVMDVLVRGHWRRQAHGPGRQLRRLIWIQPHVRMPTGAPAPGHDYDVKP